MLTCYKEFQNVIIGFAIFSGISPVSFFFLILMFHLDNVNLNCQVFTVECLK